MRAERRWGRKQSECVIIWCLFSFRCFIPLFFFFFCLSNYIPRLVTEAVLERLNVWQNSGRKRKLIKKRAFSTEIITFIPFFHLRNYECKEDFVYMPLPKMRQLISECYCNLVFHIVTGSVGPLLIPHHTWQLPPTGIHWTWISQSSTVRNQFRLMRH